MAWFRYVGHENQKEQLKVRNVHGIAFPAGKAVEVRDQLAIKKLSTLVDFVQADGPGDDGEMVKYQPKPRYDDDGRMIEEDLERGSNADRSDRLPGDLNVRDRDGVLPVNSDDDASARRYDTPGNRDDASVDYVGDDDPMVRDGTIPPRGKRGRKGL